jgi:hypothetical protein
MRLVLASNCLAGKPPKVARQQRPNLANGGRQAWRLSAVGYPEDGLREDRQHESLLAQVLPRRPVERFVVVKPRALEPPPSASEPPAGPVILVGATPSHFSTSFGRSRRRGGTVRVSSAVAAPTTHGWPVLCALPRPLGLTRSWSEASTSCCFPSAARWWPTRPPSWEGTPGLTGHKEAPGHWGSVVVGMPGFEPHQPVPSRPGVYAAVCLTCMFTVVVCCNVRVYAHRL